MASIGYARVSTSGNTLIHNWQRYLAARKFFRKNQRSKRRPPRASRNAGVVREGDTVHVTKLDRLARNTRHLLEVSEYLQRKGVALNILNMASTRQHRPEN
jgi:DNA invertase Pin-like site-specific DNA recombinase